MSISSSISNVRYLQAMPQSKVREGNTPLPTAVEALSAAGKKAINSANRQFSFSHPLSVQRAADEINTTTQKLTKVAEQIQGLPNVESVITKARPSLLHNFTNGRFGKPNADINIVVKAKDGAEYAHKITYIVGETGVLIPATVPPLEQTFDVLSSVVNK
ncbi:MAG: hypothetical protein ACKO34_01625 [Vampirovibrionales bacterium]